MQRSHQQYLAFYAYLHFVAAAKNRSCRRGNVRIIITIAADPSLKDTKATSGSSKAIFTQRSMHQASIALPSRSNKLDLDRMATEHGAASSSMNGTINGPGGVRGDQIGTPADLRDFAFLADSTFDALAHLAAPEDWGPGHTVLRNYIRYTYAFLAENQPDKIRRCSSRTGTSQEDGTRPPEYRPSYSKF